MRVLFACGGSAGHINPALAIATALKEEKSEVEILFAGNPNRMEAQLVPAAGFAFTPILVEGFQRKFSWENIKRNLKALRYLTTAGFRARDILEEFDPDIVIGTGGYVSGPVLKKAASLGYPTITHESNAYPGLTTKILARHVDKVLLAVETAKEYLPDNRDYVVTGNPVRQELLRLDRDAARRRLGVGNRVCIFSFGGSNGSLRINEAIAGLIAHFKGQKKTHHIHGTGRFGVEQMPRLLEELGVDQDDPHLDIREYIYDMDDCYAAADLVICRSGAMTLTELQAVGRASILIPSPNVAENHQYVNAMVLGDQHAAIVIEEKDLTGQLLTDIVQELVDDPQELRNLTANAKNMGIVDGLERITAEIYSLLEKE